MTPAPTTSVTVKPSLNKLLDGAIYYEDRHALFFLAPILGPTCTLLLATMSASVYAMGHAEGRAVIWSDSELAGTIGIGTKFLDKHLARLQLLNFIVHTPEPRTYRVGRGCHLTSAQVERLPSGLGAMYYEHYQLAR